MKSKVEAIKAVIMLSNTVIQMSVAKQLVEDIMDLGARDAATDRIVRETLANLEKARNE